MSIPFVPGNTLRDPTRETFHKSHVFDYLNSYPRVQDRGGPPYLGANVSQHARHGASQLYTFPKRTAPVIKETVPSWAAYDRQVLRFYAYFKESVHERPEENFRVRRCVIYYYLADDSMMVEEPRTENSGLPQGKLIRRHRIPKDQHSTYKVQDLNIGSDVTFYSRTFHVVDCDQFTAEYFNKHGLSLNPPEEFPADPYTKLQEVTASYKGRVAPARPEIDKLRQFLQNDRKVLRFFCSWDDRPSMFGDIRPFVLNYFLSDDTIEVHEIYESNSGRDPFPAFFRRQPLPKSAGPGGVGFYTPHHLRVGGTVNVYGRRFLLRDCDEFTRDFYRHQLGIEQSDVVPEEPAPAVDIAMPVPPPNGFGSEEDSLGSFLALVPKPPRKDVHKFMANDGKILRFAARMDTTAQEDVDRQFIVSFYLADDTVSVYEKPVSNSGIAGGKFLERSRIKVPDGSGDYGLDAFRVGNTLEFNRHRFVLEAADEYTLNYLRAPHVDHAGIVHHKLGALLMEREKPLRAAFAELDPTRSGTVTVAQLRDVLLRQGVRMPDEEFGFLSKFWDTEGNGKLQWGKFCDVVLEAVFSRSVQPLDTSWQAPHAVEAPPQGRVAYPPRVPAGATQEAIFGRDRAQVYARE